MAFVIPQFSKGQINRAGDMLIAPENYSPFDLVWADEVLANWRASHGYPINTFQATLRMKLRGIDGGAIVAQRLKRTPSIIFKLKRFEGMKLARMQDIGGLRAVVGSVSKLRRLEAAYRNSRLSTSLYRRRTIWMSLKTTAIEASISFTDTATMEHLNTTACRWSYSFAQSSSMLGQLLSKQWERFWGRHSSQGKGSMNGETFLLRQVLRSRYWSGHRNFKRS